LIIDHFVFPIFALKILTYHYLFIGYF